MSRPEPHPRGIKRSPYGGRSARSDRIAIYKVTGWPAIGAIFAAVLDSRRPQLWTVEVGGRANVDPRDRGQTRTFRSFPEALAVVDGIRRRAAEHRWSQRAMPSRLRPRPGRSYANQVLGPIPGSAMVLDRAQQDRARMQDRYSLR